MLLTLHAHLKHASGECNPGASCAAGQHAATKQVLPTPLSSIFEIMHKYASGVYGLGSVLNMWVCQSG